VSRNKGFCREENAAHPLLDNSDNSIFSFVPLNTPQSLNEFSTLLANEFFGEQCGKMHHPFPLLTCICTNSNDERLPAESAHGRQSYTPPLCKYKTSAALLTPSGDPVWKSAKKKTGDHVGISCLLSRTLLSFRHQAHEMSCCPFHSTECIYISFVRHFFSLPPRVQHIGPFGNVRFLDIRYTAH